MRLRLSLTHNSGILRGGNEQDIFFLHLTVQEFLVSAALASIANEQGWQGSVEIGDQLVPASRIFLAKKPGTRVGRIGLTASRRTTQGSSPAVPNPS